MFEGCDLKDPAVLIPQGSTFANTSLVGDTDALLWEIPPDRTQVIGAILVRNCTFEGCTFMNVGFAGPPEFIRQVRNRPKSLISAPTASPSDDSSPRR